MYSVREGYLQFLGRYSRCAGRVNASFLRVPGECSVSQRIWGTRSVFGVFVLYLGRLQSVQECPQCVGRIPTVPWEGLCNALRSFLCWRGCPQSIWMAPVAC